MDTVYFDFSRAFDTVQIQHLLVKCSAYGIDGKLLAWIKDFLSGQKQRVSINGTVSEWSDVTSGIPQGSILGPLLFLVFINNIMNPP